MNNGGKSINSEDKEIIPFNLPPFVGES